ncbi:glycogen synthase GlgA [Liquorilactobacillus sicerae]|uniref:glycogen synthase GlgA n=1 Tax=Liquorilactobacillus sicerae TaxID=1416943 RepID=UPI002480A314|nr:glycogen synthase GlgA [Liquorilactobacillus sicerae]
MKILFAAAECAPFFKTGGLGDVVGALPRSLKNYGHDVRVILPFFAGMKAPFCDQAEYLFDFTVNVGWRKQYCGVKTLVYQDVRYYFIDNLYYFGRPNLYGYYDDGERFAFFQQAVIEVMEKIDFIPDVLHLNDYHTSFIPFLLREKYGWINAYCQIATVLTIHNLEFQGQYDRQVLPELFGMGTERFDDGTVRFNGAVNFMKAGILYADRVNTVSPSYAREIQTPEFGCGLDPILRTINGKLTGILNGIDFKRYDPATDPALKANFNVENLVGKQLDKTALQTAFGLPVRKDLPLIGVVSRLTYQKGFKLLVAEMENLLQFDVQLVLLGTGYQDLEHDFRYFAQRYPQKCAVKIDFDVTLAQQIYAGCDLFLMPSAFEPCGLSQMMAMRYGTLPIVHQIGGLQDSVQPYNPLDHSGTGFGFSEYVSFYLMEAIKLALQVYHDPKTWKQLVGRAMSQDFSWETASLNYDKMYHEIIK